MAAAAASSSSAAAPMLYACVAYGDTVLAEHSTTSESQPASVATAVLSKISAARAEKLTYTHGPGQMMVHYVADGPGSAGSSETSRAGAPAGLAYLLVARPDLPRRVAFACLARIRADFLHRYPPGTPAQAKPRAGAKLKAPPKTGSATDYAQLPAYGAAAFNARLAEVMRDAVRDGPGAVARVQDDVADVRHIMTENIERVLERGERIDLLVDKTDRLGGSARDFRLRSRNIKRRMWWKNTRLMVLLVVVVVFLIYLFVGFGCGLPAWSKCVSRG